jgi:serine/threonine protein phosphatase 1
MGKTFVLGDVHGGYRALRQCLDRSGFDYQNDHLICLGDVCDGWPETKACIDELLSVKQLTYLLGNHDWWTLEWMTTGRIEDVWFSQGGEATVRSYTDGVPPTHIQFFQRALPYFLRDNKIFVHAGFDPLKDIARQGLDVFLWDRNLARAALDLYYQQIDAKLTLYDEVYLGHTPIPYPHPLRACEVWLMDTGAGWSGVLSMMNIETKEVFTSDPVPSLYPGVMGRTKK